MTKEEIRLKAVEYAFKNNTVNKEVIEAFIEGATTGSEVDYRVSIINFLVNLRSLVENNRLIKGKRLLNRDEINKSIRLIDDLQEVLQP